MTVVTSMARAVGIRQYHMAITPTTPSTAVCTIHTTVTATIMDRPRVATTLAIGLCRESGAVRPTAPELPRGGSSGAGRATGFGAVSDRDLFDAEVRLAGFALPF
jgi:hypothetical protein